MNAALQRFVEGATRSEPLDPRVDRGIPVACSVLQGEPHYDPAALRMIEGLVEVLLDGDSLDLVVAYDIPAGRITCQRRDWRGRVLIERGAPVLETFEGLVEVHWLPPAEVHRRAAYGKGGR